MTSDFGTEAAADITPFSIKLF